MKHHPDRYSDPNDKKKATDRFKAISAAYSVLRDRKWMSEQKALMSRH